MYDLFSKLININQENIGLIFTTAVFFAISLKLSIVDKRYIYSLFFAFFGIIVFWYLSQAFNWALGLGADSFFEAEKFSTDEAYFWIKGFFQYLQQSSPNFGLKRLLISIEILIITTFISYILIKYTISNKFILYSFLLISLVIPYNIYAGFQLGQKYRQQLEKQFDPNPNGFTATEYPDLFVYIGESTSSLNMSLYGYPLNTTPYLDSLYINDVGFLRFDKVRSSHTHTSSSLARALAVTSANAQVPLKYWGIAPVILRSGRAFKLYSAQPINGSNATFARFVYAGADVKFPKRNIYRGNYVRPELKDHQLLPRALKDRGVVFFHSYAGHGEYLDFISLDKSRVIRQPKISNEGLYGDAYRNNSSEGISKNINNYNRAITYIDRNLSQSIENVKKRSNPAALIYFADHGEAVYAGRAHDSSNYIDEMTAIPVIIYFNDSYRKAFPSVFASYRAAASTARTKLADQISPTILDILRIESKWRIDVPTLASSINHPRPYIVERETLSGSSKISLEYDNAHGFPKVGFWGGNIQATQISVINERHGLENKICYHRSNSFAKALRGAAVANCLEFDVVASEGNLNVYHPPRQFTGLRIEHLFRIAAKRGTNLWIDGKNLDDPGACNVMADYIVRNHKRVGSILVEFPSTAIETISNLTLCINKMKAVGVQTSYYVPTDIAQECARSLSRTAVSCRSLDAIIFKAVASGSFSDLSFDYGGYPAINNSYLARKLKWNTWAIRPENFHSLPRHKLGFIIMDTSSDPND